MKGNHKLYMLCSYKMPFLVGAKITHIKTYLLLEKLIYVNAYLKRFVKKEISKLCRDREE